MTQHFLVVALLHVFVAFAATTENSCSSDNCDTPKSSSSSGSAVEGIHRLTYFDGIGKGEAIRLALHHAGIPFEDDRVTGAQWRESLKADVQRYRFGQLPALLTPRGNTLVQSAAIMRYIGRIAAPDSLYPIDVEKAALVDSLLDQEADMFLPISVYKYKGRFGFGKEALETVPQELVDDVLPKQLEYLANLLKESDTGWLANTAFPSIADFVFGVRLNALNQGSIIASAEGIVDRFEPVKTFVDRFYSVHSVFMYYKPK